MSSHHDVSRDYASLGIPIVIAGLGLVLRRLEKLEQRLGTGEVKKAD